MLSGPRDIWHGEAPSTECRAVIVLQSLGRASTRPGAAPYLCRRFGSTWRRTICTEFTCKIRERTSDPQAISPTVVRKNLGDFDTQHAVVVTASFEKSFIANSFV